MKPRILIDANPVVQNYLPGHHVSGIGRTTLELIKALNQIENIPVDIMLYSQNMKGIGGVILRQNSNAVMFICVTIIYAIN